MEIHCPKCGGKNIHFNLSLQITAPAAMLHRLSKKAIANKQVRFISADWPKVSFFCLECCYSWPVTEPSGKEVE